MRKIMITGGCGFIGSNLIKYWLRKYPDDMVINLDGLTYAARPAFLAEDELNERYKFSFTDITNRKAVDIAFKRFEPDHVIHLAAESHVCRSIEGPSQFVHTNVVGTLNLLEAFRVHPTRGNAHRFHHVSTDEVFGEVEHPNKFSEVSPYDPKSPYAASKAASDHLVRVYVNTYGLDAVITNCSNNFGPNQHGEKLIPKAIISALFGNTMTVYGNGSQVRDWLFVDDHCAAIDQVFHKGIIGETYCVGGDNEMANIDVINTIAQVMNRQLKIKNTDDRPSDDKRYAIDTAKIRNLGWDSDNCSFRINLEKTVEWYRCELSKHK